MARLEPNSVEQCRWQQAQHDELVAAYENELSFLKQRLYTQYERKYNDFCRKELLKSVEREAKCMQTASTLSVGSMRLNPAYKSDLVNPPQSIPRERIHPQATFVASLRVSIPETRIPSEQAQLVRSSVSPSSLMPDSLPAPRGLKMSLPLSLASFFQLVDPQQRDLDFPGLCRRWLLQTLSHCLHLTQARPQRLENSP
jgi:hypothetical protein